MGTKNLSEIPSERESISHVMQVALDEATDPWGVKVGCLMFLLGMDQPEQVERVEVKDVRLPVQLQRAMAAEAEAAREARAKGIAAEGEQKASRALKEAAAVIHESPSALQVKVYVPAISLFTMWCLQLRYLQTLNSISAEKNSTIIFPFPVNPCSELFSELQSFQVDIFDSWMKDKR